MSVCHSWIIYFVLKYTTEGKKLNIFIGRQHLNLVYLICVENWLNPIILIFWPYLEGILRKLCKLINIYYSILSTFVYQSDESLNSTSTLTVDKTIGILSGSSWTSEPPYVCVSVCLSVVNECTGVCMCMCVSVCGVCVCVCVCVNPFPPAAKRFCNCPYLCHPRVQASASLYTSLGDFAFRQWSPKGGFTSRFSCKKESPTIERSNIGTEPTASCHFENAIGMAGLISAKRIRTN